MRIIKAYNLFKPVEKLFSCPYCNSEMSFTNENSLACSKKHCFDLSKHGYINFSPNQGKTKYTKDLFEYRRHIFESGFYDPLIDEIKPVIKRHFNEAARVNVLDAGCGEGYFASRLFSVEFTGNVFAMDLQKEAVFMAAKESSHIKWMVGDLSNIPLKTSSVDLLLNIFTPANYNEFLRVMNKCGLLIKIIPGEQYLKELRECVKDRLANKTYSNERVLKHLSENTAIIDKKKVFYKMPVNEIHIKSFINMTPLMFDINIADTELKNFNEITIDAEIVICGRDTILK